MKSESEPAQEASRSSPWMAEHGLEMGQTAELKPQTSQS